MSTATPVSCPSGAAPGRAAPLRGSHRERLLLQVAVSTLLLAAVVHASVVAEHLEEAPAAGWFFVAVSVVEAAAALALVRWRDERLRVLVVVAQMATALLWLASRTTPLPFVPAHSAEHLPVAGGIGDGVPELPAERIEPVGLLDSACTALELVCVLALLLLVPPGTAARLRWLGVAAVAVAGAARAWVLR